MNTQSMHLFVKVSNLLDMPKRRFLAEWKGVFTANNGRVLSYDEVREALYEELTKGHAYIPLGDCDNFDYVNGGCKGHTNE